MNRNTVLNIPLVKKNRNTVLKYSDSFIPKQIVDLIIPIPIRFLITPIRLNTNEHTNPKIIVAFLNKLLSKPQPNPNST